MTNITLPCPWSVPWLAFSRATRPNSETAMTVTLPIRFAPFMSAWNAASACASWPIVDRHAAVDWPLRAVRVPPAEVDLHRLDAHVGANQRGRRTKRRAKASTGIDRAASRHVPVDVEGAQRVDGPLRVERGGPERVPLGLVGVAEPGEALGSACSSCPTSRNSRDRESAAYQVRRRASEASRRRIRGLAGRRRPSLAAGWRDAVRASRSRR